MEKTHIYKNAIRDVIAQGRSVLFLLPEINLTAQFLNDFKESFNAPLYSYSGALSPAKKYGYWKDLQGNFKANIIVGVRSALFLPINNLGLIIVDEEHDSSFKQEGRCPYNARDMALKKAAIYDIPVILGSATPMLETYYRFHIKKQGEYFSLRNRVGNQSLPEIFLVGEKDNKSKDENKDYWPFREESLRAIEEALGQKEKAIVFINRLGYSSFLQCQSCGLSFDCPNCSIGLKFYKSDETLRCHHCSHKERLPEVCPECGCIDIFQSGFGTERVEEALTRKFPNHSIARFDREQIKNFKMLTKTIRDFEEGRIDILVGTQMISKGYNFKNMNTVVVLGTDALLNFPDFRANERAWQMLTQVAGRSGRYQKRGRVCIQTMNPDHFIYQMVKESSFEGFYSSELSSRQTYKTPPFKKICLVYVICDDRTTLIDECDKIKVLLNDLKKRFFKQIRIFGPRPASIEKKINKYTWCLMIDSSDLNELHNTLKVLENNYKPHFKVSYKFDIDPYLIG